MSAAGFSSKAAFYVRSVSVSIIRSILRCIQVSWLEDSTIRNRKESLRRGQASSIITFHDSVLEDTVLDGSVLEDTVLEDSVPDDTSEHSAGTF